MTDMQMTTYIAAAATEPVEVFGLPLRRTMVDYAPLMARSFEITSRRDKHTPSLTLDGVAEECQRLVEKHQQDQFIVSLHRVPRSWEPWDHLLALSASYYPHRIGWEEQLLRELDGRRDRMADHLGINLHERSWWGHRAGMRPDPSRLNDLFDVEVDYATGDVVHVMHAGDFFYSGDLPRR